MNKQYRKAIHVLLYRATDKERSQMLNMLQVYEDIELSCGNTLAQHDCSYDCILMPCRELAQTDMEQSFPKVIAFGPLETIQLALSCCVHDFVLFPLIGKELPARIYKQVPLKFNYQDSLFFYFDPVEIRCEERSTRLTYLEFKLLKALCALSPEPLSRECLYSFLPEPPADSSRSLDMTISKLRKKIKTVTRTGEDMIKAERGQGYRIITLGANTH
ncbi:MAG: winged helix-turn-helix domain-containing protein [Spirochaetota bacterium]